MRVTVVGSGDAFGSGGRLQTCINLAPEGTGAPPQVLVDCGATSLTALRQQKIDANEIATVLLTHLHGDHFGGVPFLILDGQFRRRTKGLTVVGPRGTAARLVQAMEALYPGSSTVRRRFEVNVIEHRERHALRLGPVSVTAFEVNHPSGAPAYALRVEGPDGASMAYSGDTEWTEALVEAADGADLFLCEGYSRHPIPWHLDLETLTRQRDRLRSRRLVLTHLSPSALSADLAGWSVAHDGLQVDLEG